MLFLSIHLGYYLMAKKYMNYLNVFYSENTGEVKARNNAGGIAGGMVYNGTDVGYTIEGCKNTGEISASGDHAGGIVGLASGLGGGPLPREKMKVAACYNLGPVSAGNYAGGIVGRGWGFWDDGGPVNNGVGGTGLLLYACYSTGRVSGSHAGALAGQIAESCIMSDCFFDPILSGQTLGGDKMPSPPYGGGDWKEFSLTDWPGQTVANEWWGTGTGMNNRYWKSLGNKGNGSSGTWILPTLWWE